MNKEQDELEDIRETREQREKEFIDEQLKFLGWIKKTGDFFTALIKPFIRGLAWVVGEQTSRNIFALIFVLIMFLSGLSFVGFVLWIFITIIGRWF